MSKDSGFTIPEMLASLFILSLASVSISQIVSSMVGGWERTQTLSKINAEQARLIENISDHEAQLRSTNWTLGGPSLEIDNGPSLILAVPKIEKSAHCVYDLVGRRCR